MKGPLADKHAVVTGGARGIGAAIARALCKEGARVTVLGRTSATLIEQAERLRGDLIGASAQGIPADVTDAQSVEGAFAQAAESFGVVSLLVNNAGQAASAPFEKTEAALWHRMLEVNLTGTFLCIQAALPGMKKQRFGRIVNIASTAGLTGYRYVSAYCAAKHGVIGLTRALALEVARDSITVNALCPGFTETDMVHEAVSNIVAKTGRLQADVRAELAGRNPQGRFVQPEEVANAVRWLCLPGSEAVTGQALSISGGEVT